MRIALGIVGLVLLVIGAIWMLQGLNVIGGSVMTGQSMWVWIGAAGAIVGLALAIAGFRPRVTR